MAATVVVDTVVGDTTEAVVDSTVSEVGVIGKVTGVVTEEGQSSPSGHSIFKVNGTEVGVSVAGDGGTGSVSGVGRTGPVVGVPGSEGGAVTGVGASVIGV